MTHFLEFACPVCGWEGTEPTRNAATGKRRCPDCGSRVIGASTLSERSG